MRRRYAPSRHRTLECPHCPRQWFVPYDDAHDVLFDAALAERETHITLDHRAAVIAERMTQIEKSARARMSLGQDLDWQTHPLAVEWRALMREWWALPALPHAVACLSPTYNRGFLTKGPIAPMTAGERAMLAANKHQRALRLIAATECAE